MMTYAVYNFILFGATISAYLYEKSTSKNMQTVFYFFAFLIPFFFLAIRYDIGTDYHHYVDYFHVIAQGGFVPKEPGYILVNKVIAYFNLDVQWLFVFFGFFTMLFAYKALPKEEFLFGVFLFIVNFYLYQGYSVIRQGLALAIMAYAIKYIYNRDFKKYLFWSIVAMMFHLVTAFILLILYPVINRRFNKTFLLFAIIILFILIKYTHIDVVLLHAIAKIFPKYAWYLNSEFIRSSNSATTGLGVFFKVGMAIVTIFFKDKIEKRFPYANITINFYTLYIIFYIFSIKIMIFFRVEQVFVFAKILSITYLLGSFRGWNKIIASMVILGIYLILYEKYINYGKLSSQDVYINPYQTVFQRSQ